MPDRTTLKQQLLAQSSEVVGADNACFRGEARHERFRESDALRRVFERVVGLCIASDLVGGEAFSIDASLIKADVEK